MRPLLLEITGIGPFVDTQHIDFASMDDRALFLIHGPTGQGKSFIFDAMCYALYADTPAGREGHLKSDYLPVGVEPVIEFRFRLGGDEFRVRRSLKYDRPKKKGDGVTTSPETQILIRLNPDGTDGEVLAEKKNEVNSHLKTLLGLEAGQFRQVVMIPQGDFRRLLLAGSDDREELLEKLFDTALYKDIQARLKEMEDEADLDEGTQQRRLELIKNDLVDLWRAEDLNPAAEAPFMVRLTDVGIELEGKVSLLADADAAASAGRDKAVSEWEQAGILNEFHLRLNELQAEQTDIENSGISMKKLEEKLEQDSRALALKESHAELQKARRAVGTAEGELKAAVSQLDLALDGKKSLDTRSVKAPEWREQIGILDRRIRISAALRDEDSRRKSIRHKIDEAGNRLEAAEDSRRIWSEKNEILIRRRADLDESLAALDSKGTREERQKLIHRLETLVSLRNEHSGYLESIIRFGERASGAQKRKDAASSVLMNLKDCRELNLAGVLAASLEEGKPCPVCGSVHHPVPSLPGDAPSTEEFESAESELSDSDSFITETRTLADTARRQAEEASDRIVVIEESMGEDADNAPDRIRQINEDIGREEDLRKELELLLGRQLPELSTESERITADIEQNGQDLKNLKGQLDEMEAKWNIAMSHWPADDAEAAPVPAELPELIDNWDSEKLELSDNLSALARDEKSISGNLISAETDVGVRKEHRRKTLDDLTVREREFAASLTESGFKDETALEAALTAAESVEKDRSVLEEWKNRMKENTVRLEETRKLIENRPQPNLNVFDQARRKASDIASETAGKYASSRENLRKMESLRLEFKNLESESRKKEHRNAVLRLLSGQVRGTLPPKISLNRFFLARRLEEVLIQATLRLSLLSRGRFTLKRRDEGKTAAAQAGLDLLVSDAWTGTERPVNTLSGGQLFMASLSLALGLADVVQARSGGVRLEALFIDEGFGTLDDEALQGVLRVLNDLRENRMVGVISHVPELKRQIADRIEIYRDDPGSSARLVTGA